MALFSAGWLLAPVALAGCPIPVPLEPEGGVDAGASSPPVILSPPPLGPIIIDRDDSEARIFLTIRDNDIHDRSYVNLYVNYSEEAPSPARSSCVGPGGEAVRIAACLAAPLCGGIDPLDDSLHFLEAMVADQPLKDDPEPDDPLYRALPEYAGFSLRAWQLKCNPVQE